MLELTFIPHNDTSSPGSVQGQVGWGSQQPGPVEGFLPMTAGVELDDL